VSVWAVLLAAGGGSRSGGRKQFWDVGGQRAVDRVVRTSRRVVDGVVLVLPEAVPWDGPAVDALAVGGRTRSQSVRAGLALVPPETQVVVIHDAAHPLVRERLMHDVIACVQDGADGGVCVLPMTQVVERVQDGIVVEVLPKADQVLGQSPTAFRADVLRQAHADGAEVVEDVGLIVSRGGRVATTPGDPINVHITTAEEWVMACALAKVRDGNGRSSPPDAADPVQTHQHDGRAVPGQPLPTLPRHAAGTGGLDVPPH